MALLELGGICRALHLSWGAARLGAQKPCSSWEGFLHVQLVYLWYGYPLHELCTIASQADPTATVHPHPLP